MEARGIFGSRRLASGLVLTCVLAMVLGAGEGAFAAFAAFAAPSSQAARFADPAFQRIWERSDLPMANGRAARSWAWGTPFGGAVQERYREAPNDVRTVQYFDKARMEINDPAGNPNDPYYVTNGRLVVEMASGEIQLGLNNLMYVGMSEHCVAGDCGTSTVDSGTPSFADVGLVSSLVTNEEGWKCRTSRYLLCQARQFDTGTPLPTLFLLPLAYVYDAEVDMASVPERFIPAGDAPLEVKAAAYIKETQHNIPDVFWQFLNSEGTVYERGSYGQGKVVDWVSTFGFPITEPYCISIRVGSTRRLVLFQAFERRTLTYSPSNPDGWRVEMGNVGAQYLRWRADATPVCSGRGVGHFAGLIDFWYAHGDVRRDLGCPTRAVPFDRVDPNLRNIDLKVATAYQPFERGSMLYVDRQLFRDSTTPSREKLIYVLFGDGKFMQFVDNWAEGEPVSSGASPPAGLLEPGRGFGKVWREGANGTLRERLGWATAAEQGGEGRFIPFGYGEVYWSPVPNKTHVFYGPDEDDSLPVADQDPAGWALRYKVFDDPYKERR